MPEESNIPEESSIPKSRTVFLAIWFIVATFGIAAYVVLAPTVVKLPSAPPSVLTAEEYHQADSYCKLNGLEVEVSTHNRWIFAVACKRTDGLLLAIQKTQSMSADKRLRDKFELTPESTAPIVPLASSTDKKPS